MSSMYNLHKLSNDTQVVIITTVGDLRTAMLSVQIHLEKQERTNSRKGEQPVRVAMLPDRMTFGNVRAELTKKGYRVKSNSGLKAVLERYGVPYYKNGKDNWVNKKDFLKIPDNDNGTD